jgi:hypothetical protein
MNSLCAKVLLAHVVHRVLEGSADLKVLKETRVSREILDFEEILVRKVKRVRRVIRDLLDQKAIVVLMDEMENEDQKDRKDKEEK